MGMAFRNSGPCSRGLWLALCAALLWLVPFSAHAAPKDNLQFDLFLGFSSANEMREGGWSPVIFEIENDGPTFTGTIELSGGDFNAGQSRFTTVELPTNTRKRVLMTAYGSQYGQWNARLLDERKRVRAERLSIQPRVVNSDGILLGCLPMTFAGMPGFPELKNPQDQRLVAARMETAHFPDSPLPLEGLDALYLNSGKVTDIRPPQAMALVNWVRGGGRLILAVEQLSDVNGTPWLQQFLPMEFTDVRNQKVDEALSSWLTGPLRTYTRPVMKRLTNPASQNHFVTEDHVYRRQPSDNSLGNSTMAVATGTLRDAVVLAQAGDVPLIVQAPRGKGSVTVLTFSPEREPFKSWKNRTWFWARMLEAPSAWFETEQYGYGGWSVDEVFGALIDSRQVRKLPVGWLLALLVVYLIVIGPLDQYWLKKINRQMLTWITFPAYVALFSLLIWYIGYRLRAGETEWNELHVVDVLPRGDQADFRGRTFASIYSSINSWYALKSDQAVSAVRGEVVQMSRGGQSGSGFRATQTGSGYRADIYVPVWSSLLYVCDWMQPDSMPFMARHDRDSNKLTVENFLGVPLNDIRAVIDSKVYAVGNLKPNEKREIDLQEAGSQSLNQFVMQTAGGFPAAVESRRSQFGGGNQGRIENRALTATVASFIGELNLTYDHRGFTAPAGFDLSPQARRGDTILLAFAPNHSFTKPINDFTPIRSQRDTLLRLVIPARNQK